MGLLLDLKLQIESRKERVGLILDHLTAERSHIAQRSVARLADS